MLKIIRHPDAARSPYWLVRETVRGQTPLHCFGASKPPEIIQALPEMEQALDEADTAFVCLNICDDLSPQARGALKRGWALVQGALAKFQTSGVYTKAVKDPATAYSIVAREREALREAVEELKRFHHWAHEVRPGYGMSEGALMTAARIQAAEEVLNGKPQNEPPRILRALEALLDAYAPNADKTAEADGEAALHSAVKEARAALRQAKGR